MWELELLRKEKLWLTLTENIGGALIIFIDLEKGRALWSDGVFKPITEIEIHTQEEE